jgi:hypothetical protein
VIRCSLLKTLLWVTPLLVFSQTDSATYRTWLLNPEFPDSLKHQKAVELLNLLKQRLQNDADNPTAGLSNVSLVQAPDRRWRILTFTALFRDGHYENFGLLQFRPSSNKGNSKKNNIIYELRDQSLRLSQPLHKTLDPGQWYGALYYAVRKTSKNSWLLLGLNMHDQHSRIKVAEPLSFSSRGQPRFGAPIIRHKGKTYHRLILEYKADAQVRLNWDDRLNMIVYDNLTPLSQAARGAAAWYVPDGSYNGLRLRRRIWEVVEDVDARNPPETSKPVKPVQKGLLPPDN